MWRNGAATKSKNMTWESSNGDFPHAHTAAVIFSSRSAAKPPGTSGGLCTKKFSTKRQQYLPLMQKKLPRRPNPFSPPFCRCRTWHSLSFSLPIFPPQKISYPHVTTSGRKNPHGFCPFPSAFDKRQIGGAAPYGQNNPPCLLSARFFTDCDIVVNISKSNTRFFLK